MHENLKRSRSKASNGEFLNERRSHTFCGDALSSWAIISSQSAISAVSTERQEKDAGGRMEWKGEKTDAPKFGRYFAKYSAKVA